VPVDTLAARLRSEAVELSATAICPPFVGAWARPPGVLSGRPDGARAKLGYEE
jgi:hypothetical protein